MLLLLTLLLGAVIGSSGEVMARTQESHEYSQRISRGVQSIASHRGAIGLLNLLVLLWRMGALVGDMRRSLGVVFRKKQTRPFLAEFLLHVAIGIIFLIALTVIAVAVRARAVSFACACEGGCNKKEKEG